MNVPYLDNEAIWHEADSLRASEDLAGHNTPPLDVLYIIDVILRFDVVTISDLWNDLRMDAAIVPATRTIYVDSQAIESWERQDHWIEKRLRFSVAHEIGHFQLHGKYQEGVAFTDPKHFKSWIIGHRRNGRLEDQADEFAGRFLVPPSLLREEFDRIQRAMMTADPAWQDIEGMRTHVARKIAPRFGVNHQVIETRFSREDIWPLQ